MVISATEMIDNLKFNHQGLILAIAQDYRDGTILMMGWMNSESIQKTLDTDEAHYWSRSRSHLWPLYATDGHIQKVKELLYDCDGDTILLKIEQIGDIAYHTGARSCFLMLWKFLLLNPNLDCIDLSNILTGDSYTGSIPILQKSRD
jgi:phosphoribosyl-AMP cyclohydrolase/phosphoribosyl-ATP pyrophosphohydrolase/phosphoribosyl-AMP cyclohydrolase